MNHLSQPPVHPRRLVFLGTPEIAVAPLRALHQADFEIVAVVTRPDARRGRRGHDAASPVKNAALDLGIPVTHDLGDLDDIGADLGVVVAYGRLIPGKTLERLPMVNLHFSLLPRWRGAAPVERALLAGDSQTGVCVMGLEESLDTGPIYACQQIPIEGTSTSESLRSELSELGALMLVKALCEGLQNPEPQTGEPTYAHKITKADLELDWKSSAAEIDRVVRMGGARTRFRGKIFKIHAAELADTSGSSPGELSGVCVGTGDGTIKLVVVQPEGKARMAASDWLNGAQPDSEERFQL